MPAEVVHTAAPKLESTFKARDVEGAFDLYFYRPTGFWLAQFFARLKMTPAGVSLLAGIFGVVAGHLYFYRDLSINVVGMVFHVFANTLDNADGQLARLTHRESREGRIIDSIADHLVFVSVYVHLTLRYLVEGWSPAICLLALAAGVSHALQGAAADYYRNTYLYFVTMRARDGLGFLIPIAIGLSEIDLAQGTVAEASTCVVSELYSSTGNAGTTLENVA